MRVQSLPPLPQPVNNRGPLVADIPYTGPVTVGTKLGEMPRDYHSYSGSIDHDYVACENGACSTGGQEVWREMPTYDTQGAPVFATLSKHIEAEAKSPVTYGAIGGLLGGMLGGFVGAMTGAIACNAPGMGALIGAAAGALTAGGGAAHYASGDRVKLEWQERKLEDHTMVGYTHSRTRRTKEECTGFGKDRKCRQVDDGWNHRFNPKIESTQVGTYWEPEVVHYRD